MLLEINKNLWINVDEIEILRLIPDSAEPKAYFKLNKCEELFPLTSVEYAYLVSALHMFSRRKIAGD
jgi:hypothetical protein